jgi:ATP-dependent Zn protease
LNRKKSIDKEFLRRLATHEGGHTVSIWASPCACLVDRVSIRRSRNGRAYTHRLQKNLPRTISEIIDAIAINLAGMAAEKLLGYEQSVGAASDLASATRMVKKMVLELGMGKRTGVRVFDENEPVSGWLRSDIDRDIRDILEQARQLAKRRLIKHRVKLDAVIELLLERQTLGAKALEEVLGPKA